MRYVRSRRIFLAAFVLFTLSCGVKGRPKPPAVASEEGYQRSPLGARMNDQAVSSTTAPDPRPHEREPRR
jgi:hypothetical protein